jgi:nucleoside-diphosphate-sugar epimerase
MTEHFLAAGHHVTVLDNVMYGQQTLLHFCAHPDFDFVCGDARDRPLVAQLAEQADVVIPLAAVVGAPACDRDPWLARSVNIEAIQSLAASLSPRQLLLIPTTNSGYGTRSGALHCTEETPLEPISLYGQTKVQAEAVALERERTISFRLATVFGMSPRMRLDLLVNHFVHAAVTDGTLVIFEKDFKRNYVHIRDVADAFCFGIENCDQLIGRPYNLGLDDANLSKAELAEKVRQYVPNLYIHYAEIGTDPDQRDYIVSNRRLREAGFEARRSIDAGIVEIIKGYRMLGRAQGKNVTEVRPGWLIPATQPGVPATQPRVRATQPQVRATQPQVPAPQPQVPAPQPQVQAPQPQVQASQPQVQASQPRPRVGTGART